MNDQKTVGLLWYDGSDRPLAEKIQSALPAFMRRFGPKAKVAAVYVASNSKPPKSIGQLRIIWNNYVLPGHLYLVKADSSAEK